MQSDTIRVLLADDHAMMREGVAALVADEPDIEIVGQCGNGLEVLPQVLELDPDVVVLDVTMPGLNGLDLCRDLTKRGEGLGVLILTMHNDEGFVAQALESGATGYLLKESAADQLGPAIRRVAAGDLYLGPGIPRKVLERIGDGGDDPYQRLSSRERQVLQLIAEGRTNRKIAEMLGLATKTIDTHRTRLMRKLNIHDQTSLVKFAIRRGIISVQQPDIAGSVSSPES
ncbi:MAG: response regulator transcription factor [Phycisphaerae bacterium]|nr:response regulator transcription factor [Phycisphaerae bacterium]